MQIRGVTRRGLDRLLMWQESPQRNRRKRLEQLRLRKEGYRPPCAVDRIQAQLLLHCPKRGSRLFSIAELKSWTMCVQAGSRGLLLTLQGEEQPWFTPFYRADGKATYSQLTALDRCMADLLACTKVHTGWLLPSPDEQ